MPAGHFRFVVKLLINAIGNILSSYQIFFFFICIFAINAIHFKHKFTKFYASTQFWQKVVKALSPYD